MPLITQKIIKRSDLQANPNVLYIFGDNLDRIGYGGQAGEMRDEPNAIGVATLYKGHKPYTDTYALRNIKLVLNDLAPVIHHLHKGGVVIYPEDGVGTGIANLQLHAPKTLDWINCFIEALKETYNV